MIHGIGTDIVKISRIRSTVEKSGKRFLDRVYSKDELEYTKKKRNPYPSMAARFAAKEAFIKALKAETTVSLNEIEVVNDPDRRPSIRLTGKAQDAAALIGITNIQLSLSHDSDYATAFVILEK